MKIQIFSIVSLGLLLYLSMIDRIFNLEGFKIK